MRRTVMAAEDGRRLAVQTDDGGTDVLDESGMLVRQHGSDRHEEEIVRQQEAGLRVLEDGHLRPESASSAPTPSTGLSDGAAKPEIGPTS
jgi:hypothetical protein